MKLKILLIFLLSLFLKNTFACCEEKDYRLLPIGISEGRVIFVVFDLVRNCERDRSTLDEIRYNFTIEGTVALYSSDGGELRYLMAADSLSFRECLSPKEAQYSKSKYEEVLAKSYHKAFKLAHKNKDFKTINPGTITFNDSLNAQILPPDDEGSPFYQLIYPGIPPITIEKKDIRTCNPLFVCEVRNYESAQFTITIFRMRCSYLDAKIVARNRERFADLKTAFWKEPQQDHGLAKDYFVIKKVL